MIATRTDRKGIQIVDTRTVSRCAFARRVTLHAEALGCAVDSHDLDQWLSAVWPMVAENMDPARWARAYLIACGLVVDA